MIYAGEELLVFAGGLLMLALHWKFFSVAFIAGGDLLRRGA